MKMYFSVLFLVFALAGAGQNGTVQSSQTEKGKERLELLVQLIAEDTGTQYLDYYKEGIALANANHNPEWEIEIICALGEYNFYNQHPEEAVQNYTHALELARKNKLTRKEIFCLEARGNAINASGDARAGLKDLQEAFLVSKNNGLVNETAGALESLGLFYLGQRDYDQSLNYFNLQLRMIKEINDSSSIATCENNIGLVFFYRGNYRSSISHYTNALEIKKKLNEEYEVAQAYLNIGIAYKDEGTYDLAFENLLTAARYFELQHASRELASCYNTIGNVHFELGENDTALAYHFRSLVVREKINFKSGIAKSLTNIGQVYKEQGKYDLALLYLDSSLAMKRELNDPVMIASSLDLIGEVYFLQKNYAEAERFYKESLTVKKEIEDPKGTATTLNNLGELYLEWNKLDAAAKALEEGRTLARDIGAKNVLLKNYETTIGLLRKQNKDEEALRFFDLFTKLKAEILDEQKNKAIAELQVKYETEKKEQELALFNERDKVQEALLSRQHALIFSLGIGAALLLSVVLLLTNANRARKKDLYQSRIIIEQKQTMIGQKQTMMRELHHRVKNNLQVLSSIIDLQQHRTEDEQSRVVLRAIEHRVNAMLLIHKDLYSGQIDSQVDLAKYIRALAENLLSSYSLPEKKINLSVSADPLMLDADRALSFGFICNEVISNAFKHAFHDVKEPQLTIRLTSDEETVFLSIADNGSGMPGETDISLSNSFGIRLIHLLAGDLAAEFSFTSDSSGTRFEIKFPLNIKIP